MYLVIDFYRSHPPREPRTVVAELHYTTIYVSPFGTVVASCVERRLARKEACLKHSGGGGGSRVMTQEGNITEPEGSETTVQQTVQRLPSRALPIVSDR